MRPRIERESVGDSPLGGPITNPLPYLTLAPPALPRSNSASDARVEEGASVGLGEEEAEEKAAVPARVIKYVKVPLHWFTEPLYHSMKTVVRPPTKLTRRKQQTIEIKTIEEVFIDLMNPLEDGDASGFEWVDTEKTALVPTKDAKTFWEYKYEIKKPSLVDKIWRLESQEPARPAKYDKQGQLVPFRRGHGCARLHLSTAAAARGERTDLLAQLTGNVIIGLKVPKFERTWPTMTVKLAVSTLDMTGHIVWGNTYGVVTAAALRKQMRFHLQHMIDSQEYPTLSHMAPGLTNSTEEVRPVMLRLTTTAATTVATTAAATSATE
jgi:hypothetical protein